LSTLRAASKDGSAQRGHANRIGRCNRQSPVALFSRDQPQWSSAAQGIALILMMTFASAVMSAAGNALIEQYATLQVLFFRCLFGLLLTVAWARFPMTHKNDKGLRSHYITLNFAIPDAPASDELSVALCASTSGRMHPRIGNPYEDMEEFKYTKEDAEKPEKRFKVGA
jgi:hypothetical protein